MYITDVACGHLLVSVGIKCPETSDMENHCIVGVSNSFFNPTI